MVTRLTMIDGKCDKKYEYCWNCLLTHISAAGTQLSSTSRISTPPISGRNLLLSGNATSRIHVSIAACSLSSLLDMRTSLFAHAFERVVEKNTKNEISLKPIDIVVLKKLSDVVNVVPVIAKSDSLTLEERLAFKERIKEEFSFHNLKMYPYDNDELDDEERAVNAQIKVGKKNLFTLFE